MPGRAAGYHFPSFDWPHMTHPTLPLQPEATLALTAFLRGVERRAAVFAELLSGSTARGDQAVAAAMLGFRHAAAERPLPDWDLQFWRLLLATPQMRRRATDAHWPGPLALLAAHGSAMRAVVLLHVLAGLDETQAAAALCITRDLYARALQRALDVRNDETNDRAALVAATQQCVRQIPAARLVALAQHRERALRGTAAPRPARRPAAVRPRPLLAVGLVVCVIAFAASFLLDDTGRFHRGARPQALPPPSAPLETFDADFALMTHRDFEQLANPGDRAILDDLGFYAWYSAQTTPATDSPADALHTGLAATVLHGSGQGGRHGAR
jgi:hypothetical protein